MNYEDSNGYLKFSIGFLLDGIKEYVNISQHQDELLRQKGKMTYYRPQFRPEIETVGLWDYANAKRLTLKVTVLVT